MIPIYLRPGLIPKKKHRGTPGSGPACPVDPGGPAWKARGNPWGPVQEEGIYFTQLASGTAGRVVLSGSEEFNCLSLLNFRADDTGGDSLTYSQ